jgi:hypothetical protein
MTWAQLSQLGKTLWTIADQFIVPALRRRTHPATLQRRVSRSEAARLGYFSITAPADAPLERRKPRHGAGAP